MRKASWLPPPRQARWGKKAGFFDSSSGTASRWRSSWARSSCSRPTCFRGWCRTSFPLPASRFPLKTKSGPQIQSRPAAIESVRDVEVEFDERGDDEQAAAGPAMPVGVVEAGAELADLRHVHERRHTELRAVQHRGERHPQLA